MPYTIVGWEDHYEVSQSRSVSGPLPWFRCPTDLNSRGYCRLMRHEKGPAHYGVWIAVVALAARQPRSRRTGELSGDVPDIADQVRMPTALVGEALARLVEIGWLEGEPQSSPTTLPPRSQSTASTVGADETRREKTRREKKQHCAAAATPLVLSSVPLPPKVQPAVDEVVLHYQLQHPRARPGNSERAMIERRLGEGYSVGDLKLAIDGCHQNPINAGRNDRGKKYLRISNIFSTSERVADHIETATGEGTVEPERQESASQANARLLAKLKAEGRA